MSEQREQKAEKMMIVNHIPKEVIPYLRNYLGDINIPDEKWRQHEDDFIEALVNTDSEWNLERKWSNMFDPTREEVSGSGYRRRSKWVDIDPVNQKEVKKHNARFNTNLRTVIQKVVDAKVNEKNNYELGDGSYTAEEAFNELFAPLFNIKKTLEEYNNKLAAKKEKGRELQVWQQKQIPGKKEKVTILNTEIMEMGKELKGEKEKIRMIRSLPYLIPSFGKSFEAYKAKHEGVSEDVLLVQFMDEKAQKALALLFKKLQR